jgi:hypothetical protein
LAERKKGVKDVVSIISFWQKLQNGTRGISRKQKKQTMEELWKTKLKK